MKYGSYLRMFLAFILCLFLFHGNCAQKDSILDNTPLGCPMGTKCIPRRRCRPSALRNKETIKNCGLTYNRRKRICCPIITSTLATPNTMQLNIIPITLSPNCGNIPPKVFAIPRKEPTQGDWPWMVEIDMRDRQGSYDHLCTAVMISSKHALSAAHCFSRRDPSLYLAKIGHVDTKKANDFSISRIDIPDTYRRGKFDDDIAVLTLSRDVNVQPICLPQSSQYVNMTGKGVSLVGWGTTKPGGPPSDYLRQVFNLPVVSNSECSSLFGSKIISFHRDFPRGITDGFLCAGFLSKTTVACEIGSGAPLMYFSEESYHVVGVSSFSLWNGCTNAFPEGFTRVSKYLDWIFQKITSGKPMNI